MVDQSKFASILGAKVGETKRPEPFPAGAYEGHITGFAAVESGKKGTPGIEVDLKLTGPVGDDIDADELAAAGGLEKLVSKTWKHTFWLTEDSKFIFSEFLTKTLEIDSADGERTLREMIPEMVGKPVIALMEHEIRTPKGSEPYTASTIGMLVKPE